MNSFRLTLNCNPKIIGNKVYSFYTLYDKCFDLIGEWECALEEISFIIPKKEKEAKLYLITSDKTIEIPNSVIDHKAPIDRIINEINFKTKQYCEWINTLEKIMSKERIVIPEIIKKNENLTIHNGYLDKAKEMLFLLPSEILCEILGFDYDLIKKHSENVFKKYQKFPTRKENYDFINENRDIVKKNRSQRDTTGNSFYICSDICKPIIHGNLKRQILRYINCYSDLSNNTLVFKNPYYTRIDKNHISYVNIVLYKSINYEYDMSEKYEDMKNGKIEVKLHFRKLSDNNVKYSKVIEKVFNLEKDGFDTLSVKKIKDTLDPKYIPEIIVIPR